MANCSIPIPIPIPIPITITDAFGTLTVTGPDASDTLTFVNIIVFADQKYDGPIPGIVRIGTGDPDYIDGSDDADGLSGGEGCETLLVGQRQ